MIPKILALCLIHKAQLWAPVGTGELQLELQKLELLQKLNFKYKQNTVLFGIGET